MDDTCYLLSFDKKEEMNFVYDMLNSKICKDFISSLVFLDNKRPITVSLLNRISIKEVAKLNGKIDIYQELFEQNNLQRELFVG